MLDRVTMPDPTKVFDVKNLAEWLRKQDPKTTYYYYDTNDCLLERYGKQRWRLESGWRYADTYFKESKDCRWISVPHSSTGTYGEALARAEYFLKHGEHHI